MRCGTAERLARAAVNRVREPGGLPAQGRLRLAARDLTAAGRGREPTYHLWTSGLRMMKPTRTWLNTRAGPWWTRRPSKGLTRAGSPERRRRVETEPLPATSPLRDERLSSRFASSTTSPRQRGPRRCRPTQRGHGGRCVQAVIDVLEGRYEGDRARCRSWSTRKPFKASVPRAHAARVGDGYSPHGWR